MEAATHLQITHVCSKQRWRTRQLARPHTLAFTHARQRRHDMCSHVARQKLAVSYSDNPQTDALELLGEIEFPNLAISTQASV